MQSNAEENGVFIHIIFFVYLTEMILHKDLANTLYKTLITECCLTYSVALTQPKNNIKHFNMALIQRSPDMIL